MRTFGLENLYYQVALIITGAVKGSNTLKVLESLHWNKLATRRKLHMTLYTYKVINNINNFSNKKLFDSFLRINTRQGLRHTIPYSIPTVASHAFRKSTILSCISNWNTLTDSITRSNSMFL